jgi:hypothetical protein
VGVGSGGGFSCVRSADQSDRLHTTKRQGSVSVCPGLLDCLIICCCNMEKKIFSDEEVFEQIKPRSRKAYEKCWKEFKELNPEINFEEGPPGEGGGSVCQKYISSSKPTILGMASRLGEFEALSEDPLVEVDAEKKKDTLDIKPMMQEIEECIVLEEDPEMYAMAGIELVPVPVQARVESTIRQAMASVPTVNGTTVNFRIVVVNDLNNCGPITF